MGTEATAAMNDSHKKILMNDAERFQKYSNPLT